MPTKRDRRNAYLAQLLADAADSVREDEDSPEHRFGLSPVEATAVREELAGQLDARAIRVVPLNVSDWAT